MQVQGNCRDVGACPPDTVFLPVVLLPGALPVKASPVLHIEPYLAHGSLVGDRLAGSPDTTGERVGVQGAAKPDALRQQVFAAHLGAEHHSRQVVETAVETFHSQTPAVIAYGGGGVVLPASGVVQKIVCGGAVSGVHPSSLYAPGEVAGQGAFKVSGSHVTSPVAPVKCGELPLQ